LRPNVKIKVISLESSISRRNSISRQFEQIETPFDFFDAVTPKDALHHIKRYDEREFFRNCGRYATETEIACYASHLALWRQCSAEGVPYLILEDDAKLASNFLTGMLVVASQIRKLGFIRISLPRIKTALLIDQVGPFDIQYCRRAPLLALGYAVAPHSAKGLTYASSVMEEPVDKFMQRFWRHGQPVYALAPPVVELAQVASDSDIGARARHEFGFRVWMLRASRKAQNSTQRQFYNLKFIGSRMKTEIRETNRIA